MFVFFFKQKTAYELRISDWSSDVCSSDLPAHQLAIFAFPAQPQGEGDEAFGRRPAVELDIDAVARRGARVALAGDDARLADRGEIGRASCREGVCKYV